MAINASKRAIGPNPCALMSTIAWMGEDRPARQEISTCDGSPRWLPTPTAFCSAAAPISIPTTRAPGYAQGPFRLSMRPTRSRCWSNRPAALAIDGVNRILDYSAGRPACAYAAHLRLDRQDRAHLATILSEAIGRRARAPLFGRARPLALNRGRDGKPEDVDQTSHHRDHGLFGRRHDLGQAHVRADLPAREDRPRSISRATPSIGGNCVEMREKMKEAAGRRRQSLQPFRRRREPVRGAGEAGFADYAATGTGKTRYYIHDADEAELHGGAPGTFTLLDANSRPAPICCSTRDCTAAW